MNYYRRYVGDYIRDTARLSMLEHGAYNLLLDYYYSDERPLPASREEIYLLVRAMTAADRKAVDKVLSIYFTEQHDGWHQSRVDKEIERAHDASEAARMAGARGAESRWGRRTTSIDGGVLNGKGDGEPYSEPYGNSHSASDSEQHGEQMANTIATRAGDPTTNHQPPTASHQPPKKSKTSAGKVSWAEDSGFTVPANLHEAWRKAYPALSLECELSKAHAWAIANPANRKGNWGRFLVNWLGRSQDSARPATKARDQFAGVI